MVAHLIASSSALLGNVAVRKAATKRRVILVLLSYLFAGLLDSIVLISGLEIEWLPMGSGLSAWSVLLVAGPVASSWLLMGHLAAGLLIANVKEYNQIHTKNLQLVALNSSAHTELRRYRESLEGAIAGRIQKVLDQISEQLANLRVVSNPALSIEVASNVRKLSENEVRLFSHQLSGANETELVVPEARSRFSWAGFVKFGGDYSANLGWVFAIGSLQLISLALAIGDLLTTAIAAATLVIGFPVLLMIDRLRLMAITHIPQNLKIVSAPFQYVAVSLIGMQIVRPVTESLPSVQANLDTFALAVPIGAVSIWFLVFLIRGFSSSYQNRVAQLSEASAELELSLVKSRAELNAVRTRLAKLLHGSVQGRLASVSLAIAATADENYKDESAQLMGRAAQQLELVRADLLEAFSTKEVAQDFSSQLTHLTQSWLGLVEIDLELPAEIRARIESSKGLTVRVSEAIQECLTNAVRHGNARVVHFSFSTLNDSLVLTATNAISQPTSAANPGLGWQQMLAGADSIETAVENGMFTVKLTWGAQAASLER
ncbi:hypothetical protein [Rhodoluna sp.]|uniref:hypothetical protein n=1 Tax=Rhodoluna sp. TaxID=1969481 RepID=UPI0025F2BC64|nr:hypothetical protein [Rhodoluna sp.]